MKACCFKEDLFLAHIFGRKAGGGENVLNRAAVTASVHCFGPSYKALGSENWHGFRNGELQPAYRDKAEEIAASAYQAQGFAL